MSFSQNEDLGTTFRTYNNGNHHYTSESRVSERLPIDEQPLFSEYSRKHLRNVACPIDDRFEPSVQSPVEQHHAFAHYQGWSPYNALSDYSLHYNYSAAHSANYNSPYSTSTPFNQPKFSLYHVQPPHLASASGTLTHSGRALSGSFDPTTGFFYRTPEHPRLRTAQACEKCRTRKAKCSGEHPSCKRCLTRGLICQYAKEGRVRGPNRSKHKPSVFLTQNTPGLEQSNRMPNDVYSDPAGSMVPTSVSPSSSSPPISPSCPNAHSEHSPSAPFFEYSQHRRNSFEIGPDKVRPTELQLETVSNLYRTQNNLQKGLANVVAMSAGYPVTDHQLDPTVASRYETLRDMSRESELHHCYSHPCVSQVMSNTRHAMDHDASPCSNPPTASPSITTNEDVGRSTGDFADSFSVNGPRLLGRDFGAAETVVSPPGQHTGFPDTDILRQF